MGTTSRMMIASVFVLAAGEVQAFAQQGAALQLAPFNSVAVDGGAHVVIRPGSTQRVKMVTGNSDHSRVRVTQAGELAIDKCRSKCPKGYQLEIEVVTPNVTRISVTNGGRIRVQESFPRRNELALEVSQGGSIDARTIGADRVTASIEQGGGILTVANAWLFATVAHGGMITYWGDAQVRSSVDHAGAVAKGKPGELTLPASEIGASAFRVKRH